jgi:tetratricopeptide (TPR) repeat protein
MEQGVALALALEQKDEAIWLLADLAALLRGVQNWDRWRGVMQRARVLESEVTGIPLDAPHHVWDWDLARLEACEGRWEEAERLLCGVVERQRALGWRLWEASSLYELGYLRERMGRESEAISAYQRSIALFAELNGSEDLANVRQHVAELWPPFHRASPLPGA